MGIFGIGKKEAQIQPQPEGKACLMVTPYRRLKPCLYYVGTSPEGYLTLMQTLKSVGKGKKKIIATEQLQAVPAQPEQQPTAEQINLQ